MTRSLRTESSYGEALCSEDSHKPCISLALVRCMIANGLCAATNFDECTQSFLLILATIEYAISDPKKSHFARENGFWNHWFSEQNCFFEKYVLKPLIFRTKRFWKNFVRKINGFKTYFSKNNFVRKINGFKTRYVFSQKTTGAYIQIRQIRL